MDRGIQCSGCVLAMGLSTRAVFKVCSLHDHPPQLHCCHWPSTATLWLRAVPVAFLLATWTCIDLGDVWSAFSVPLWWYNIRKLNLWVNMDLDSLLIQRTVPVCVLGHISKDHTKTTESDGTDGCGFASGIWCSESVRKARVCHCQIS